MNSIKSKPPPPPVVFEDADWDDDRMRHYVMVRDDKPEPTALCGYVHNQTLEEFFKGNPDAIICPICLALKTQLNLPDYKPGSQ